MKTIKLGILALSATFLFSACTNTTENETATRNMQDQLNAKDQRISQLEDSLRVCSSGAATTMAAPATTDATATGTETTPTEKPVAITKLKNRPVTGKTTVTTRGRQNTLDNNNQDGDIARDVKSVKTIYTSQKATANYYSGDRTVAPATTGNDNGIRSVIKKDSLVGPSGLAPGK